MARLPLLALTVGLLPLALASSPASHVATPHPARASVAQTQQAATAGHWLTAQTVFPLQIESAAATLGRDGNIYVFGGVNAAGVQSTTYIYHPQTNHWTAGAPMPAPREGGAAVTLPDGTIAVLGGGDGCFNHVNFGTLCHYGAVYNQVLLYAPRTNTWTELAPMLTPRYRGMAAFYEGRLYAMGGADGNRVLRSVEVYDARRNRWAFAAALPRPVMMAATATVHGRLAILGGTDGGDQTYSSMLLYNGRFWRWGAGLPQATAGAVAAVGADGRLYVIGGQTTAGYLATTQAYIPARQEWVLAAPAPSPRSVAAGVGDGAGHIYVIGGAPWETAGRQVAIYATPGSEPLLQGPGARV